MKMGKIVEHYMDGSVEVWRDNEWNYYLKGPLDRVPYKVEVPDDPSDFCMHYNDPDPRGDW